MSRYQVPPCAAYVNGEAIVGWDRRRGTYFCHTYDLERRFGPDEVEEPELSIGTESAEIPTVAMLLAVTFAFTTITDDTVAHLLEDPRREAVPPTGPFRLVSVGQARPTLGRRLHP